MRAGKLDRSITLQSSTTMVDALGRVVSVWTDFAIVRAQLIQRTMADKFGGGGNVSETVMTFRLRWIAGLTLNHRVTYAGEAFGIKEIKELGRMRGLDLRVERIGSCVA